MVAYLEKTNGNAEFHEIIDFLTCSSIHYALIVSLVVSTTFDEQFWMAAKSKTINNVRHITATVAGKPVSISEASIRSDLQFNDAAGIDVLPNQAIFDTIQLMGPSSSTPILDSIPEGSGRNHEGQSSSDRSLSGNEDGLILQSVYDLCVSLCIQCLNEEKIGKEEVLEEKVLEEKVDAEGVWEDKQTLELSLSGDTMVLEEKESEEKGVSTEDPVSTAQPKVSTDKPKVSIDELKVSTDKDDEGTAEPKDGNSDESATPTMTSTPTPTIFGNDETIAQVLIIMSQNKVKQKEKEKGVEIKDTEDTDRLRTKIKRSILTLKPLPKIDPIAKGKKKIEEDYEL
ncbi:hypothetical protein Tco_1094215 [Tanacetum coccineum]|uniref:Uncharacterized protein n=1 Tax=Tanacetum coccineum TaxID=301880 RepID=A0ABQ5IH19_9ASTR